MAFSKGSVIGQNDIQFYTVRINNNLLGVGDGTYGYGQALLYTNAPPGYPVITPAMLLNTENALENLLRHQGNSTYSAMYPYAKGMKIQYDSRLPDNYQKALDGRLNAASVGDTTTYVTTATSTSSFNGDQTITVSASFGSHNQARYFFNAGGQFDLSFSHPTAPLAALAAGLGNIRFGAGTQTIAGTSYTGTTKIGGAAFDGVNSKVNTSSSFYTINQSLNQDVLIAYHNSTAAPLPGIEVYARYNGAGAITFTMKSYAWSGVQPASPPTIAAGSTFRVAARMPSTTYLTNSWGTPTMSSTITQASTATKQWYFYNTSTTATVPAGTTEIRMIIIGGGGGGETATGVTIRGGGGGGAGQVLDTTISVNPYQQLIIGVGAGGPGTSGYYGFGYESSVQTGGTTYTALPGGTVGTYGGTLAQGGQSGSGYTGGPGYGYGRIFYGGGGGGGSTYYGFAAGQAGTVTQASGGIGGVGVTIGPINGNYYNVGGGGEGGMNVQLINWTLTDETGYKYGGGRGGVYVGTGGHAVAGTGGGGGGGAQNTSSLNVIGGNGGSGIVAIYM